MHNELPQVLPSSAVLSVSIQGQTAPAHTASTLPAVEAHTHAHDHTHAHANQTLPPAASATLPPPTESASDVDHHDGEDLDMESPVQLDIEAEATLSGEIRKLWLLQRDGKASVRRTRAEMKAIRVELSEKLYNMKLLLVRTGRGGGWSAYLRGQKLPVTTADRYVREHEAMLAPPTENVTNGDLSVEEVRQVALKMVPKLNAILATAELSYAFLAELFWKLKAAEGQETDDGLEVFRTSHDEASEVETQDNDVASPAPAAS